MSIDFVKKGAAKAIVVFCAFGLLIGFLVVGTIFLTSEAWCGPLAYYIKKTCANHGLVLKRYEFDEIPPIIVEAPLGAKVLVEVDEPENSWCSGRGKPAFSDKVMANCVGVEGNGNGLEVWKGLVGDMEVVENDCVKEGALLISRHRYWVERPGYSGIDLYVGPVSGSAINPVLFLKDVGSYDFGGVDAVQGEEGKVHVLYSDKDNYSNGKMMVVYVVGDVFTGKWESGGILDFVEGTPLECAVAIIRTGGSVFAAWCFDSNGQGAGGVKLAEIRDGEVSKCFLLSDVDAESVDVVAMEDGSKVALWLEEKGDKGVVYLCKEESTRWIMGSCEISGKYSDGLVGLYHDKEVGFIARSYVFSLGWRSERWCDGIGEWLLCFRP